MLSPSLSSPLLYFLLTAMLSFSSMATSHVVTTHPESMEVRLEADGIGFGDIVLRGDDRREHADSLSGRAV